MSKPTPEELVRDHLDAVYNLALRLCGNAAEAEDLAQEVLLKAIRALPGFRGEAQPRTWLHRITINAWKNRVQSRGWRFWSRLLPVEKTREEGTEPAELAGPDPAPEAELERAEEARSVERAVARLSVEERAALVLREFEGKSYEEIAGILGIPVGTVKSRLYRARVSLAAELEGRHGA